MLTILVLCALLSIAAAVLGYLIIFSGAATINDGSQPTKTRNIKPTPSTPNLMVARGNPTLWISKEEPLSLRVVVFSLCLLLVIVAVLLLRRWYEIPTYWGYLVPAALVFVVIAYGLLRLSLWANWVASLMLWILILLFGGSSLISYKHGNSESTILAIFIPALSGILWCLHIFGKHKSRFR